MAKETAEYTKRIAEFMTALNAMQNEYYTRVFKRPAAVLTINKGGKYDKIIKERGVYCFIEKATGNILKAASYAAPAKHARGNIYNADMLSGCNIHGAAYMDEMKKTIK